MSAGAGPGALLLARRCYQRDLEQAHARLLAFEPATMETPVGRIEYAEAGDGAPALVIAAEDDTSAPYEDSHAMAERIPGARFVSVPRGGRALTQLGAGARRALAEFLDSGQRHAAITYPSDPRPSTVHWVSSEGTAVDLYWIPLGAGGHFVRFNGRAFEALDAARQHRARQDLYHAALLVQVDGQRYAIELAPSPNADEASRGVVATGAVGSRLIGALRLFRYEVRCWPGGSIPDLDYAVGIPCRLTTDPQIARRLIDALPKVPTPVWGRDELRTGDMWNSNSLISWSLATAGLPVEQLQPPPHGRAPGWDAGLTVARGEKRAR